MELPEQSHPYLFSQMLQMFPHIPHNIVQIYTMQYANDADMCAQMLNLQSNKYKEIQNSGLIQDSSITEQFSNLKLDSSHCGLSALDANDNLNFSTKTQKMCLHLPFQTSHESNPVNHKDTSSNADSSQDMYLNREKSCESNESSSNGNESSVNGPKFFQDNIMVNNNEQLKLSVPGPYAQSIPVSQALHVNIDDNDGSLHSWRPVLSNSLSSDFFLPQPAMSQFLQDELELSNNFKPVDSNDTGEPHIKKWNEVSNNYDKMRPVYPLKENAIDIENHLHLQKVQMNTIRYEVINAKIELSKLREAVESASQELGASLHSKQVLDMAKLNEENARLRLECQCLCMEVDYHLKGSGRLGEINEDLYKNKNIATEPRSGYTEIRRRSDDAERNDNEFDESRKWECTECTFANHPAIVSCEMCHSPRQRFQNYVIIQSPPDTCYCHPNENSQKSS